MRAGAAPAGHPAEQGKEQQRVAGVQEEAGQVVPGGLQAEELAVQHVGEPRHRMPVGRLPMQFPEGPVTPGHVRPCWTTGL